VRLQRAERSRLGGRTERLPGPDGGGLLEVLRAPEELSGDPRAVQGRRRRI